MKGSTLIAAMAVGSALFATGISAQEALERKELKKEDVPQAVIQSFEKDHAHMRGVTYEQETRQGNQLYEVDFKQHGKQEELVYNSDGSLVEEHEQIGVKALPAVVRQTMKKEHPHAAIQAAEKVMDANRHLIGYETDVKEGKQRLELMFDTSGKIIRQGII